MVVNFSILCTKCENRRKGKLPRKKILISVHTDLNIHKNIAYIKGSLVTLIFVSKISSSAIFRDKYRQIGVNLLLVVFQ